MTEAQIQDAIRLELGDPTRYPDVVTWRNNCGVLVDAQGRRVRYGVGNPGGADLLGIFTTATGIGVFIAAEIKAPTKKQTDEQKRFQAIVERRGGDYVVLHSVEEARRWVALLRAKYSNRSTR